MTAPDGGSYTYTFDFLGRLTSVGYPDSTTRQYLYEATGAFNVNAITGVVDENGARYETATYSSSTGQATSSVLAPNQASGTINKYTFSYSPGFTSTTVVDPLGQSRTYGYTWGAVSDPLKPTTLSSPCLVCSPSDTTASRTYDGNNNPASITDFNGNKTTFVYNVTRGLQTQRVEASTDTGTPSSKRTIETDWHATFRLPIEIRTKNSAGTLEQKEQWVYNTRGQSVARCLVDPADTSGYSCSATTAPPSGALVSRWTTTYCEAADVTAGTCPIVGLMTSTNGPRSSSDPGMGGLDDTTTYTYYASDDPTCATAGACAYRMGDLWKTTNALGQVVERVAYDLNGRVERLKDANGTLTDFVYDARGRLTDKVIRDNASGTPSANDALTHIDYDAAGNVSQFTQPDGDFLAYSYDDAHRLLKITDNQGNSIDYCSGGLGSAACLDAVGNKRSEVVKDSGGTLRRRLSRAFNALGELTQVSNAAGTAVQTMPATGGYDTNGNRTLTNDAYGVATKDSFDALNRLKSSIGDQGSSDPSTQNAQTSYVYDTRDNLRQVTDPDGLNTVYTYDGRNRETGLSSPDTGSHAYAYDATGNRVSDTDARSITKTLTYDPLNRLIALDYPTSSLAVRYHYDEPNGTTGCASSWPVGRLTSMTDSTGSTVYCYDRRGNVIEKAQTVGSALLDQKATYTLGDRLATLTYPSGGVASYGRDSLGRVISVSWKATPSSSTVSVVSAVTYDPFGPLHELTFGSGRTQTRDRDLDDHLTAITSSALDGFTLDVTMDLKGRLTEASTSLAPSVPDRRYSYDALDRLLAVEDGATSTPWETYTYNKTGDRQSAALGAASPTPYSYTLGTHHLVGVGAVPRTLDAAGNTLTGASPVALGYNDANRLETAGSATYGYDGMNARAIKTVASASTLFTYGQDHLLGEYDATGTPQTEYLYLDDTPVGLVRGSLYEVETDQLSTPRQVFDPGRPAVVWSWDYKDNAFGNSTPDEDPDGDAVPFVMNLRFPGQYGDNESGLAYNYFRDYEPGTGRYVESDPLGVSADKNTYRYALDNPLRYYDTKGQNALEILSGVVVIGGACFIIHCEFTAKNVCNKQYPDWQHDIGQANARLGCVVKILKACLSLGSVAVDPIKESITMPMEPREPEPQCEECKQ